MPCCTSTSKLELDAALVGPSLTPERHPCSFLLGLPSQKKWCSQKSAARKFFLVCLPPPFLLSLLSGPTFATQTLRGWDFSLDRQCGSFPFLDEMYSALYCWRRSLKQHSKLLNRFYTLNLRVESNLTQMINDHYFLSPFQARRAHSKSRTAPEQVATRLEFASGGVTSDRPLPARRRMRPSRITQWERLSEWMCIVSLVLLPIVLLVLYYFLLSCCCGLSCNAFLINFTYLTLFY